MYINNTHQNNGKSRIFADDTAENIKRDNRKLCESESISSFTDLSENLVPAAKEELFAIIDNNENLERVKDILSDKMHNSDKIHNIEIMHDKGESLRYSKSTPEHNSGLDMDKVITSTVIKAQQEAVMKIFRCRELAQKIEEEIKKSLILKINEENELNKHIVILKKEINTRLINIKPVKEECGNDI